MPITQHYGLWNSDAEIESVIESSSPPAYPFKLNGILYWLEAQVKEKGRIVLMQDHAQEHSKSNPICITPPEFNIRSRVHEYGGRCFCIDENRIIFNNFSDGNLYHQSLDKDIQATRLIDNALFEGCRGYADLVKSNNLDFVLAVAELEEESHQNHNCIVAVSCDKNFEGGCNSNNRPTILVDGSDFYANPVISTDGKKLAWFEWSHPYMPWDQSSLVIADLVQKGDEIFIEHKRVIVDEINRSVCQLGFLENGALLFASDSPECEYWNFFQYLDGQIRQVTQESGEFGEAHWVFGQNRWCEAASGNVVAIMTTQGGDELVSTNIESGEVKTLHSGFSSCSHIYLSNEGDLIFVAHYSDRSAEITELDADSGNMKILKAAGPSCFARGSSEPKLIQFPIGNKNHAFAYFYPPYNQDFCALENSLPPLLVVIHGGPTSRATSEFSELKQYFCSKGFALLDINHRGSTGYGRKFRQALLENWGEFDADDISNAINYAIDNRWVDKDLVFIRGSSAGGYAVLRSLTQFPQLFAGGACYYGIGNLITLSEITHKFEAKYTDRLVGETFNPDTANQPGSRFVTRSPIFQIENLSSPLIMFQGEDDNIVPPTVSREVVELLKKNGVKHSYTEYPGEGHGFRQTATRVDALSKETEFFTEIIQQKLSPNP